MFGIRVTKGNVDAGNFFILQNVTDDMSAGGVCADGKFADAITVFIRAGVSAKFVAQIFVLRLQRSDAIVFYFNCEGIGFEVAKTFA